MTNRLLSRLTSRLASLLPSFLRKPACKAACYLITRRWLLLLPLALAFALDRLSKSWALAATLKAQDPILLDWHAGAFGLSLSLSMNHGVAFGFLRTLGSQSQLPLLIISSLIALLFAHFALQKQRPLLSALAASIIVGGALGNLFDRIAYKGVLDFIDAYAYNFHWYKFNIADAFITCGAILWLASELISISKK